MKTSYNGNDIVLLKTSDPLFKWDRPRTSKDKAENLNLWYDRRDDYVTRSGGYDWKGTLKSYLIRAIDPGKGLDLDNPQEAYKAVYLSLSCKKFLNEGMPTAFIKKEVLDFFREKDLPLISESALGELPALNLMIPSKGIDFLGELPRCATSLIVEPGLIHGDFTQTFLAPRSKLAEKLGVKVTAFCKGGEVEIYAYYLDNSGTHIGILGDSNTYRTKKNDELFKIAIGALVSYASGFYKLEPQKEVPSGSGFGKKSSGKEKEPICWIDPPMPAKWT